MPDPSPICFRCKRTPDLIDEYRVLARDMEMTPDEAVRREEGTYNPFSGQFACTECYIQIGMPTTREGWKAP